MTREEFLPGWALLTAQTWGRLYDGRLEPDKSQIQFEHYYNGLQFAHPEAWRITALRFAGGVDWPALQEIRASLSQCNKAYAKALPAPTPIDTVDEPTKRRCEATMSRILGQPFQFPKD